jgi:hypothetical protein
MSGWVASGSICLEQWTSMMSAEAALHFGPIFVTIERFWLTVS